MTALQQHNTRELPLIEEMERNELHLLKEFAIIDENDPDVQAALRDRVCDIINSGTVGQDMADLVD